MVVHPRRAKGPWQRFNEWNRQFCCSLPSTQSAMSSLYLFLPWISLINFFICIAQTQVSAITSHFNSWQSDPLSTLSTRRDLQAYIWRPFRHCVPPTRHIFLCCIMVFYYIRTNSFSLHQRLRPSNTIPYFCIFLPYTNLPFIPHKLALRPPAVNYTFSSSETLLLQIHFFCVCSRL